MSNDLSFADSTQLMPFCSHSLLSSFNNIYIALIHCCSKRFTKKKPFLVTCQILCNVSFPVHLPSAFYSRL